MATSNVIVTTVLTSGGVSSMAPLIGSQFSIGLQKVPICADALPTHDIIGLDLI